MKNSNSDSTDESFNFERDIGFEEVEIKHLTRPVFLISRRVVVIILIVGYIHLVSFAALLFYVIDAIQKHKEHHAIQVPQAIGIFAIVLAIPIGFSIIRVLRKPKLPCPY